MGSVTIRDFRPMSCCSSEILHNRNIVTVFPLIEAGSQIQAGSEAGGHTSVVLIEAGSLIQAGSLTEAGGLKDEYHITNCASPVALWCIVSFVRIA